MRYRFVAVMCVLSALVLSLLTPRVRAEDDSLRSSVVRIHVKTRRPDPYRPWTTRGPDEHTGSGVVIDGQRILTNAHVAGYASEMLIESEKLRRRVPAKLKALAPGMDLAILEVSEPGFFDMHPAATFADAMPKEREKVMIYGFPMGGDALSITEGVISRVEFSDYYYDEQGMRIQVDAAVNPGNSGGPAFVGGKCVGIAFSGIREADNIAYLISLEEIRLFLDDVADGTYDGKPRLLAPTVPLENAALRTHLKLPTELTGVLVLGGSDSKRSGLKEWDVITHISGTTINERGLVQLDALQLEYRYLAQSRAKDGKVALKVWRDGASIDINADVPNHPDLLMPDLKYGQPTYFVHGPIVFTAVCGEFASGFTRGGWVDDLVSEESPLLARQYDSPAFDGEQLVAVACPLFPHAVTQGYPRIAPATVKSIDGVKIKNIRHLIDVLRDGTSENVVIEFNETQTTPLVFNRKELAASTEDVLDSNSIRKRVSDDLKDMKLPE